MIGMRRYGVFPGIVLFVLFVLGAVTIGWLAYNAGVDRGLAQAGSGEAPLVSPGYGYGFWPFGPGFGWLGCLIFPLLFFLFFGAMRMFFAPWRMGMWGRPWGKFGHESWRGRFDQELEEWHRKAHGSGEQPEAEPKA